MQTCVGYREKVAETRSDALVLIAGSILRPVVGQNCWSPKLLKSKTAEVQN